MTHICVIRPPRRFTVPPLHTLFCRTYYRLAPSQWETSLQSNAASHWLDANLESSMFWSNIYSQILYHWATFNLPFLTFTIFSIHHIQMRFIIDTIVNYLFRHHSYLALFIPLAHFTDDFAIINQTRWTSFILQSMMTSLNKNKFPLLALCAGNSPVTHRWIRLTKASDAERWFFSLICAWTNGWVNNRNAAVVWDAIALIMTSL